ncbi:twin-arginine translocase subunit TatC [Thermopolyspora sp. NPDC052614]|uniref:twin-arginine translocase subunit TatC n=1 Tax=Thermopolyspora sp. NPDC052614 TaxID=3155682 RepID=UPI0034347A74
MALLKRSSTRKRDNEGRMPLMEHLRELRNRLLKAILAIAGGTVLGFVIFDPIWAFLKEPYCRLPQSHQLDKGTCTLVVNGVFDAFMVNLKVALIFGIIVSAPLWLYQIWAFVTPGLYQNERRYTLSFLGLAVPLFLGGSALAYFIMDKGLALLLGFAPVDVIPLLSMGEYLNFALAMLVIFGVSFELPLLLVFLNVIGVLRFQTVAKHQRMVIFGMFVFSAVATPSQDPISMLSLAVPMVVLFLLAEVFMYFRDRKRDVEEAERQRRLEEELNTPGPSPLDEDEFEDSARD